MNTILLTLRLEAVIFLGGLVVIVGYRMLTRGIITKGILSDKGVRPPAFSPGRLQLLIATLAIAFYYLGQIPFSVEKGEFPTIPNEMMYLLGGSHAFYLGSKTVSLIFESLARARK